MAKPSSELLSKLSTAIDRQPITSEPRAAGALVPSTRKTAARAEGKAEKITATIYATDWQRLDEIKTFFHQMGYRNLSDSEALRIACRAVRINDELTTYYEDMKREDNRRKSA
ncbi:MAG: hypothetical protein ACRD22_14985 [Terriglobia bacterium]